VLKELVDHHVEEEENKLFALAEKTDHEPFAKLGKQMKTLYDELMQEEPRLEVPDETQAAARLG
jgi:hemerythrin-like domain-containing protein